MRRVSFGRSSGGSGFSGDYNDLTNQPTIPTPFSGNYNDLTNQPALFSGNYMELVNRPTLFTGSWNDLVDRPTIYSYFPIMAEEGTSLSTGHYEWSFGNSNTSADGVIGVVLPFACELIALGLTTEGDCSVEVEALKNAASVSKSVSISNAKKGLSTFESSSVSYASGDYVNFKTITGSGDSVAGVVTAWFRREVA